ncbi:hypothetical protein WA158_000990 [Blastocystis sp. Blastoise]
MKNLLLFICLLALSFACETGEIELVVTRKYTSFASEETIILWRGDTTTGTKLLEYKGISTDGNSVKTWNICSQNGLHTMEMIDSFGDGWGSSAAPDAYVAVTINGLELFKGGLKYTSGTLYKLDTKTFNTELHIAPGSTWKYSDIAQSGSGWAAPTFSDNSWSTHASATMPAFTATTRYYRYTANIASRNSFGVIMLSLKTGEGAAVYVQGTEVYRNKLPSGTLTGQTTAISATDTTITSKRISFYKFLLPQSGSYTIAVEIHQASGVTGGADVFDFGAVLYGSTINGQCSGNRFDDGVAAGTPVGASSSYDYTKVFDGSSSSYYYITTANAATFTYTYNGHSEYVNSYAITAPSSSSYGYPKAWKVYGSNDNGNTWDFLDAKENVLFSAVKEVKTFSLRSSDKPYKSFKLEITESTIVGKLAIGLFEMFICTYDSAVTGLQYESTSFTGFANIDTVSLLPASNGYINYSVTPALPAGLTISAATGAITGISTVGGTTTHTVSATKFGTTQVDTATITLTLQTCAQPSHAQIRLYKVNKSWATEESYKVTSASGAVLFTSPALTNNVDRTDVLCLPTQVITVSLLDSFGDGWTTDAKLRIEYFDFDGSYYVHSTIYNIKNKQNVFTYDLGYAVPPKSAAWSYIQGTVPNQWNSAISAPAGFNTFPMASLPATTSTIWLFRHSFNVASTTDYSSVEIRVKARAGYAIYLNGFAIYSKNLPSSEITSGTTATGGDATSTYKNIGASSSMLQTGSNVIAIGIVNLAGNNPTTVLFDATVKLVRENYFGRNWDIVATDPDAYSSSSSLAYLVDLKDTSNWTSTPPALGSSTVIFSYPADRAEFVNKYCLTSSSLNYAYDPSDWAVYGSNNAGLTWTLLGNVTNAYFSDRKVERCFYLPENAEVWNQYKFLFTEPAVPSADPYKFALVELTLQSVNLVNLVVPPLSFSSSTFTAYVGIPFPEVTPSSPLWGQFGINPPLSLPLEIDTSTGSIRGTPNVVIPSSRYTIRAIDPKGQQQAVSINLSVNLCQAPKILFTVLIHSGQYGGEQGFYLFNKANTQMIYRKGFSNNQDNYFPFCEDADVYTLKVTDSANDGWDVGYFKILLEDNTEVIRGSLGSGESEKSFPVAIGFVIPPVTSEWKYYNAGSAPASNWNTNTFVDSAWKQALPNNIIETPVGTTQYFRRTFTIDSLDNYAAASFNVKTRHGIVVYINGQEQYRFNMGTGAINYNTYALSEKSEASFVGSAMSISFGNMINGNNVLAIEVHRNEKATTNTIIFDASLLVAVDNSYRVIDGVASSDLPADEAGAASNPIANAFDNVLGSVYVSTEGRCVGATPTWTFNNDRREYISSYTIVTGPKCNTRHPSDWEIQGSNDSINWSTLSIVTDKQFTEYKQSATFNFFNNKVYNSYRMKVTGCNNRAISTSTSSEGTVCDVGTTGQGSQLAEFGLYAKRISGACQPDVTKGWGGALEGDFAYKNCAAYYQGRIQAKCTNGVRGPEESHCSVMTPQRIRYSTKMMNIYKGYDFSYEAQVSAAEYTCSADATLPSGVNLDTKTARIYGKASNIFESQTFVITCTNVAGSISTEVYIASTEKPGLPIYAWIIIGILAVIILGVVVLCILNRTKSRKNKGHANLDKKISSKARSASKKGDSAATKTVKV